MSISELRNETAGAVLTAGDEGWDAARIAFNLLIDQRPAAIVLPERVEDVAAAVNFARESGLRVAAQRTGHNAGPLGDLSRDAAHPYRPAGRREHRRRRPARLGRARRDLGRRHRPRVRGRSGAARGLVAERRRRRLLARRRAQLARAQARARLQQRPLRRAGGRGGRGRPHRRRARSRPLLGAAGRGRRARRRHRHGVRPRRGGPALRGHARLALGARRRGARGVA